MIFWIIVIIASICAAIWFTYVGMKQFAEKTDHDYERDTPDRIFPFNTPREIIVKEWHEYDKYNEIEPTVKEYLEYVNKIK